MADTLATFLKTADDDTASVIAALAIAAREIAARIREGGRDLAASTGGENTDGDAQKTLDILTETIITQHLLDSRAAMLLSEEHEEPVMLDQGDSIIVAVDPLDGSSNIEVNVSVGTIFSILPKAGGILQAGREQLAAGFFTYGPQTTLIAALRDGKTRAFVLDPDSGDFIMEAAVPQIPETTNEYAINAAYARHWLPPVVAWHGNVLKGKDGPYGKDYRMRWVGSLVSDAYRIFRRGGVFLYPGDARNEKGRLRLVYEANPMAFLVARAGGMASDGKGDILAIKPADLHERVPLIFGSKEEVQRLVEFHKQQTP